MIHYSILIVSFIALIKSASANQFYIEPEVGFFSGIYQRSDFYLVGGIQTGFNTGLKWSHHQVGAEFSMRYFQLESPQYESLTNIPIGLTYKYYLSDSLRVFASIHWDDVLYSDFRFKWLNGFKLPKDYDIAYEGPWSWRLGFSHEILSRYYLNHSLMVQSFRRYKRRRPVEVIGDTTPEIFLNSYSLTISTIF